MDDQLIRFVLFGFALVVPITIAIFFGLKVQKLALAKGYPDIFGFLLGFYFGPFGVLIARRMKTLPHKVGSGFDELLDAAESTKKKLQWPVARTPGFGLQLLYSSRRPSAVAVLSLLGVVLLSSSYLRFYHREVDVAAADVRSVPKVVGDWECVYEDNADAELQKQIQADSYILRQYWNRKTGGVVQLYLIYRRYGRREFNHNPDQCFPAGGYILMNRRSGTVPYAGGEHQMVRMDFDGSRVEKAVGKEGVDNATVSYFFASGRRTESVFLRQQFWMATEKLFPNTNGWTLVRLNTPWVTQMSGIRNGQRLWGRGRTLTPEEAWQIQRDFMTAFGPEIERVITTDAAHDAPAS